MKYRIRCIKRCICKGKAGLILTEKEYQKFKPILKGEVELIEENANDKAEKTS